MDLTNQCPPAELRCVATKARRGGIQDASGTLKGVVASKWKTAHLNYIIMGIPFRHDLVIHRAIQPQLCARGFFDISDTITGYRVASGLYPGKSGAVAGFVQRLNGQGGIVKTLRAARIAALETDLAALERRIADLKKEAASCCP
jgi:hypothetical protein